MSLELDPSELGFKRPFTVEVSQTLRLRNPNRDPVSFKVKTTAPKQYCVRPNSGKIEPGQSVDVSVVLQPMKQDPPPETRCKDKFLVQSIVIKGEFDSWTQVERTNKQAIVERKIRVHYLPASGPGINVNGHDGSHDESTTLSSPPPSYTPRTNGADDISSKSEKSLESGPYVEQHEASSGPDTTTPGPSTSRDDLIAQLVEANATIARLRKDTADQGLRRRKEEPKGFSSGAVDIGIPPAQTAQNGVPVRTTALLCLFAFLLALLF